MKLEEVLGAGPPNPAVPQCQPAQEPPSALEGTSSGSQPRSMLFHLLSTPPKPAQLGGAPKGPAKSIGPNAQWNLGRFMPPGWVRPSTPQPNMCGGPRQQPAFCQVPMRPRQPPSYGEAMMAKQFQQYQAPVPSPMAWNPPQPMPSGPMPIPIRISLPPPPMVPIGYQGPTPPGMWVCAPSPSPPRAMGPPAPLSAPPHALPHEVPNIPSGARTLEPPSDSPISPDPPSPSYSPTTPGPPSPSYSPTTPGPPSPSFSPTTPDPPLNPVNYGPDPKENAPQPPAAPPAVPPPPAKSTAAISAANERAAHWELAGNLAADLCMSDFRIALHGMDPEDAEMLSQRRARVIRSRAQQRNRRRRQRQVAELKERVTYLVHKLADEKMEAEAEHDRLTNAAARLTKENLALTQRNHSLSAENQALNQRIQGYLRLRGARVVMPDSSSAVAEIASQTD